MPISRMPGVSPTEVQKVTKYTTTTISQKVAPARNVRRSSAGWALKLDRIRPTIRAMIATPKLIRTRSRIQCDGPSDESCVGDGMMVLFCGQFDPSDGSPSSRWGRRREREHGSRVAAGFWASASAFLQHRVPHAFGIVGCSVRRRPARRRYLAEPPLAEREALAVLSVGAHGVQIWEFNERFVERLPDVGDLGAVRRPTGSSSCGPPEVSLVTPEPSAFIGCRRPN